MRCTFPRTVGYQPDGRTLAWSQKQASKELATFQLPCGKCLDCRLEYARQWAVRAVHESQMHEKNAFITLTYDDEHLGHPKLDYQDFQLFMKRLRKLQNEPMGFMAVGEYGELNKRKHWHAIIFNWAPRDGREKKKNERGDQLYISSTLETTWGKGQTDFGAVTLHSAGYVARYSAKKLVHGKDHEHEFHPIFKTSNKQAIGKSWLEKFWPDVFNHGHLVLPDGQTCGIPRYYEKWFKEHHFEKWLRYVSEAKVNKIEFSQKKAAADAAELQKQIDQRRKRSLLDGIYRGWPTTRQEARRAIQQARFKQLQEFLKL